MALAPGARLGAYEIVALIGAGGMGEVYRARDTRLGRDVAIKILPEAFVSDPERHARFEREARVISQLNHPNICGFYHIGDAPSLDPANPQSQTPNPDTMQFLVLELVEGPTLADRIARGPIPLDEALPIAKQIAEALEAAHEHGIVHRDLKPANIKLRPDGTVKVLDFGLAKLAQASDSGLQASDVSQSPTITTPAMTRMGIIMGTAAYMSPEQARGKTVDKRTDIWAFGCVLYEMLTGKRAFEGEDVSETLARILERVPDFSQLPATTPTQIRRLLRRCLQKDRRERLADIADARIEITETASSLVAEAGEVRQVPGRLIGRTSWALVAVAILAASLVSAFTVWSLISESPPSDGAVTQLTVGIEPAEQLGHTPVYAATLSRTTVTLSPDGRRLVFAGRNGNQQQLYLRLLDRAEAQLLPGTEGGVNPFFSPDGEWVGFWAAGQLKKVVLSGGPPVPLCETETIMGASWGSNGSIVFAGQNGGLWRVPAAGGSAERLTRTADVEQAGMSHRLPWVLPGGEAVLFTVFTISRRWEEAQIVAQSLMTGERRTLIEGGANPVYTPTGHIVYAKLGALWAVPFDVATLTVTGPAAPVIESVTQAAGISASPDDTGAAQFSISDSGTLVYLPGGLLPPDLRTLVWVDRRGNVEPLSVPKGEYWHPRISPDGQRVAVSDQGENRISVLDLRRRIVQRLPGNGVNVGAWSPDGSRIAFGWIEEGGPRNLFLQPADGSGPPERLTRSPRNQLAGSWSPDGLELLMTEERPTTGVAILALKVDAPNRDARNVLDEAFSEGYPALSPDGHSLAYASNESGQYEVYVRAYPTLEGKQQVSSNGGYMPAWSPSGRELFYIRPTAAVGEESEMMAVDVAIGRDFRGSVPVELFRKRFQRSNNTRTYDVAPDGRFLVVERDATQHVTETASLRIVLNWFEELKRLVPTN